MFKILKDSLMTPPLNIKSRLLNPVVLPHIDIVLHNHPLILIDNVPPLHP